MWRVSLKGQWILWVMQPFKNSFVGRRPNRWWRDSSDQILRGYVWLWASVFAQVAGEPAVSAQGFRSCLLTCRLMMMMMCLHEKHQVPQNHSSPAVSDLRNRLTLLSRLIPQLGEAREASPAGTPAFIRPNLLHPQTHSTHTQPWLTSYPTWWVTTPSQR